MPLVVYKSSAGSGKTTTLVSEYLKIAMLNPNSFRNILAITFTNKAANEMKQRVIETLQELADVKKTPSKKLDDLINQLSFDRITLSNRAKKLLSLILHNYDEFAISTIDSFIHRIIRTFATDVQLPQNFEVVVDNDDIIPDIIESLYDKVGHDKELTKVLISFVLAEADEENSYDPTSKLVDFIKHHMNEDGFKHISKLDDLNIAQLGDIIIRINKKIRSDKSKIISIAKQSVDLCYSNNLDITDFSYGKTGILAYFIKLSKFNVPDEKLFPGKNVQKTIDDDKWFAAKTPSDVKQTISNISNDLTQNYHQIINMLGGYFYYRLLYSKIYSLALVHEIRNLFIEFTERTGKVHISEFNKKISTEIADQPVPFIYERLGRRYKYFLIDEFQDTSVLQWYNLLPLIEESLSYGNFNMLVGDAKQAIYRFRNGEVELFSSLPSLYENDGSQLSLSREVMLKHEYEEVILSNNWRSFSEIINFNNSFFGTIIESLSDRTKQIYTNHKQNISNNHKEGGLVSLNFVNEDDAEIYEQQKLLNIKSFVEELKENSFSEKDICILCRTKKNAIVIARYLLEQNYNVVSSESLLLTNSPKVRLIIAFFKLLVYPDNELAMAEFLNIYLKLQPNINSFDDVFRDIKNSKQTGIASIFTYFKFQAKPSSLLELSTYETAEFVIREVIKMHKADIFVQYLLDYIFETQLPLDVFIVNWENKKESLFISMPTNIDAIQIMTIHKAKGLDFPAVIVDAASIKQINTKSEYWEDLDLSDFKELKVGLFPLTKKIEFINKLYIYDEEVAKTELDFLNIIYVAFTRPVKALYTISQVKNKSSKDKFASYLVAYLTSKGLWDDVKLNYTFGELTPYVPEFDKKENQQIKLDTFISSKWQGLISIASSEDINNNALESISSQSYGKLIHKILSDIRYNNDVEKVINLLLSSGLLSSNDIKIIKHIIENVVWHTELQKYFEPGLIVKNETELLLANGELIRPDRVVIDNQLLTNVRKKTHILKKRVSEIVEVEADEVLKIKGFTPPQADDCFQHKSNEEISDFWHPLTIIDYKTGDEKLDDYTQIKKYQMAFAELGYKSIEIKLVYIGDVVRVVDVN